MINILVKKQNNKFTNK